MFKISLDIYMFTNAVVGMHAHNMKGMGGRKRGKVAHTACSEYGRHGPRGRKRGKVEKTLLNKFIL